MRVILHVGTHKTGTTSIQDTLRASSDALLREGILFPEAGCPTGLTEQHMLAWAVRADKQHKMPSPRPPVWENVLREIQAVDPKKTILSAEAFSGASRAELMEIREKLDRFEVSVVLYLRNPMDYLKSSYKQQVKTGKCSVSLSCFAAKRAKDVDYDSLVERWSNVFGAENINIRRFEAAVKRGLLKDFARVVGIRKGVLVEEIRSNISPDDEIIRFIRYLNLVEDNLSIGSLSHSRQRGFFSRVRRRLLRGGPVSRGLTAVSRMLGVSGLNSSRDVTG